MHIIIGGAANGKRQYVRGISPQNARWLGDETVFDLAEVERVPAETPIILCNVEQWMAAHLDDEETAIDRFLQAIEGKEMTIILTDIGRGIVPMEPQERALRDACGRLNQHLMKEAADVTRIWYGIPQKLK